MKLQITQIAELPTSTYHTARYNENIFFIAGSNWQRRIVKKETTGMHSAQGLLYRVSGGHIQSFSTDTDMLYIVEVIAPDTLFLGAKTSKNTFQLFSISEEKVIKQQSDEQGGGCYGTLFIPSQKEMLMNTRNGRLQTVDSETLQIKESVQITEPGIRLWQIYYDEVQDIIYTSDYLGTLYKIQKKGFNIIKKFCLFDIYQHNDNHDNPPSLWGLSSHGNIIVAGDRFGGITIFDTELNLLRNFRLKKDGTIVTDPTLQFLSADMESVMSVKMLDETHFLFGSRWGNVFLGDVQGHVEKVLNVPMGIQKENSAFTMERLENEKGIEVLVTFGDGQVYSIQSTSE